MDREKYETSSSATRAQRISMWLLLALGLVSIPLGFALWITLPTQTLSVIAD